jgi:hypothetical protein
MGRSGTTLLKATLSKHPEIAIPPETHFLDRWMRAPTRHGESQALAAWRAFRAARWFTKTAVSPEAVERRFGPTPVEGKAVFVAVLDEYASVRGKARWGEKTPAHFEHVPQLLDWFPDGRIIWLVRDPRSVASSMRVRWPQMDVLRNALNWKRSMSLLRRAQRDSRVRMVEYETFVRDPEGQARAICEFIGVPFHAGMLEASAQREPGAKQSRTPRIGASESPRGAIRKDTVQKWKKHLSAFEVAAIERIAGSEMQRLGYEQATRGLPDLGLRGLLRLEAKRVEWRLRRAKNEIQGKLRSFISAGSARPARPDAGARSVRA